MGQVSTGTIMPTTSVPNEIRSSDVVTGSMMTGDCLRPGHCEPSRTLRLMKRAGCLSLLVLIADMRTR
jgi:hypothetical protein